METSFQSFLAFLPILLSGILLVGFRVSAKLAMPIVFLLTCLITYFFWGVTFQRIIASTFQGLIITISILWIIFGAIMLLNTLKYSGAINSIRNGWIRL